MKPRFQADNDLRSAIRVGVLRREPSIDFQSSHGASLDGVPDPAVLRLAATQGRILVPHDENTLPSHFGNFLTEGNESPGLLIVPQTAPIGAVIEDIILLWIASDAEEWTNRIEWLPMK